MTALEEYAAHIPKRPEDARARFDWRPECRCCDEGPGWITYGDSCVVGVKLWEAVRDEVKISLNGFGEALTMYPRLSPARWEAFQLSTCVGVHLFCDSFVDVKRVSAEWSVLHCRGCNLRVHVSSKLKTIGELRAWATNAALLVSLDPMVASLRTLL